jgi:protein TonB
MARMLILGSIAALAFLVATGALVAGGSGSFMAQHYPEAALKRGEQGKVGFTVQIAATGALERCTVTQSSGYPTLDRETCEFILQFAEFKPVLDAKGKAVPATQAGFINWRLPSGFAKAAPPTALASSLPSPLVCKKNAVTGSMLKKLTRCMTEAEWAQEDRIVREDLDRISVANPCPGTYHCDI